MDKLQRYTVYLYQYVPGAWELEPTGEDIDDDVFCKSSDVERLESELQRQTDLRVVAESKATRFAETLVSVLEKLGLLEPDDDEITDHKVLEAAYTCIESELKIGLPRNTIPEDASMGEELYKHRRMDVEDSDDLYHAFLRHMNHMTTENLHGKSEIAKELAARDQRIKDLEGVVKDLADAAEHFVNKVETGRAHSKESYAQFKDALSKLKGGG